MAKEFIYKLKVDAGDGTKSLDKAERSLEQLKKEILLTEKALKEYKKELKDSGNASDTLIKNITQTETKLKGLRSEYGQAQRSQLGMESSISKLTKGFGGMFLAIGGITAGLSGLVAIGKQSINNFLDQEEANNNLLAALNGRRDVQAELIQQANELQEITGIADNVIIEQQAYLANLGLSKERIQEIIDVSVDLAAATNTTLESAVKNATKTLGGLTGELGESIPQLKEFTAEQLRAGEGLKFLSQQFDGAAAAAADNAAGSFTRFQNAVSDLSESFGGLLVGAVEPFVSDLARAVTSLNNFETAQDRIALAADVATEQMEKQRDEFTQLVFKINDATLSEEERAAAIDLLNTKYGQYLPYLIQEGDSQERINNAVVQGTQNLIKYIALKSRQAELEQISTELNKIRSEAEVVNLKQQEVFNKILVERYGIEEASNLTAIQKQQLLDEELVRIENIQKQEAQNLATTKEGIVPRRLLNEEQIKLADLQVKINRANEEAIPLENQKKDILQEVGLIEKSISEEIRNQNNGVKEQKKSYEEIQGILDKYNIESVFNPKSVADFNQAIKELNIALNEVADETQKAALQKLIADLTDGKKKLEEQDKKAAEAAANATAKRIEQIQKENEALESQQRLRQQILDATTGFDGDQSEFIEQYVTLQFSAEEQITELRQREDEARKNNSIKEAEALAQQRLLIERQLEDDLSDLYTSFYAKLGDDIRTITGDDILDLATVQNNFNQTNILIAQLEQRVNEFDADPIFPIIFDKDGKRDYEAELNRFKLEQQKAVEELAQIYRQLSIGGFSEEEKQALEQRAAQLNTFIDNIGAKINQVLQPKSEDGGEDGPSKTNIFLQNLFGIDENEAAALQEQLVNQIDQIYSTISQAIQRNIESQRQLQVDLLDNQYERQLATLEGYLQQGLITEKEFKNKSIELEEQTAEKRRQIEKQAAARQLRIDIANATVQSVKAGLTAATNFGFPLPAGIAAVSAVAALFTAQILALRSNYNNLISSIDQKAEGGLIEGPSHAQGGVPTNFYGAGGQVELEGGEFVIRKDIVSQDGMLQLLEAINSGQLSNTTPRDLNEEGVLAAGSSSPVTLNVDQASAIKAYVVESDSTAVSRRVARYKAQAEI